MIGCQRLHSRSILSVPGSSARFVKLQLFAARGSKLKVKQLMQPAAQGFILSVPKISSHDVAMNSRQRLDNDNQIHLELASGKPGKNIIIIFRFN